MLRAFVQVGTIGLTRKFVEGIAEQQRNWPGPIHVLLQPTDVQTDDLDRVTFAEDELPFKITACPLDSEMVRSILGAASIALLGLGKDQNRLPNLCREFGVPFAVVSENTLKNRMQIARTEVANPLRLARRLLWEIGQEKRNRSSVSMANGVQCNGTPTFDEYSLLNPSPMLFFDTRTKTGDVATEDELQRRFEHRRSTGRLRLAFSGRLVGIKGVDHLMKVARALAAGRKDFTLSICGSGALEEAMQRYSRKWGLSDVVRFMGNMNFHSELVPFLRQEVDLFVSCHRQGDPSCTYLETMACGVPIAGYDNEAWCGLVRTSGCGWSTPLDRPQMLARKIGSLTDDALEEHSRASLDFARAHTFEIEFKRRMDHLASMLKDQLRN
jgi:colanic acid/amylovoran biosynthesis glycosyltransferase